MITKIYLRPALLLFSLVWIVAGCGGGGGGGAAEPPKAFQVTVTTADSTLVNNPTEFDPGPENKTTVTVSVQDASGQAAPNGTTVTLTTNLGCFEVPDDCVTETDVVTSGGTAQATLVMPGTETGTARITATVFDPNANRNVSASTTVTVNENTNGGPAERISLDVTRSRLPANSFGVPPFLGSPYIAEVTMQFRDAQGRLASPSGAEFGVSIDPVTNAAFSTLDDPSTTDVNEFEELLGNGPVESAAGTATAFVHSFDSPGFATLTVTAQDADTGELFEATFRFEIVEPASNSVPSNVIFTGAEFLLYIQGSGGQTAGQFEVLVQDGAGEPVPDPQGHNNVLVELLTERPNTGESLAATNFNGTPVSGTSIRVATTAGVTGVSVNSGTQPGLIRIRATADAADNNVNNGIDAPVTGTFEIEISDGIPFAIKLATVPSGPVSDGASVLDPNPNAPFPLVGNDVLTMQIEALVTDRRGNPPARPVVIEFGLLDSPTTGFPSSGAGVFSLSGFDGNPEEGGRNFFAPNGRFRTAGGGAGPGDTLTLFGKDVVGNSDLEGARAVEQVFDQDSLLVDEPFNLNDTTGSSVDNGNVIPYAIGRAMLGNIETGVLTDIDGVATTFLNWPVSSVGRSVIIYAQGTNGGLQPAGNIRTFGDVVLTVYPGLAPFTLTASPGTIPANTTQTVQVCAFDSVGIPVPGVVIAFEFNNASGTATVDGQQGSGTVDNATGFDGCTLATVITDGFLSGQDATLIFSAGGGTATVNIVTGGADVLQLEPTTIIGDNLLGADVLIRLLDASGNPISGVLIVGECSSEQGAINFREQPGVTDSEGETTAVITIDGLDGVCEGEEGATGSCIFSPTSGSPSATLTIRGREGAGGFSPDVCPEDG